MQNKIVTLTGPSCAGKSTLEAQLKARGFAPILSTTSRTPRAGEIQGEAYNFVSRDKFESLKEAGKLVESVEFNGNYYGNQESDLLQALQRGSGRAVWVIEPHGLKQAIEWAGKRDDVRLFSIFIDNPLDVISHRFMVRLQKDLAAASDVDTVVNNYAKRLTTMMTTERGWVAEAHMTDMYSLRLSHFNEKNAADVVDFIAGERLAA